MRRGCLLTVVGILALCLVGCGLGYFVGLPRFRDSVRDGVQDAISTQVAIQIPAAAGGKAAPGSYTITAAELQERLLQDVDSDTVDDIVIRITPAGFEFGLTTSGDRETTYTGLPVVGAGKLSIINMETTSDFLDFLFPSDDLAEAIENAVNNYLVENDLELDSISLEDGAITLVTVPAA